MPLRLFPIVRRYLSASRTLLPANLLVVFLHVELYKLGGARSSTILCQAGWKST